MLGFSDRTRTGISKLISRCALSLNTFYTHLFFQPFSRIALVFQSYNSRSTLKRHIPTTQRLIQLGQLTLVVGLYDGFTSRVK